MDPIDLVIIGAGWAGLAMAKTYHEANPSASLRIFDSAESIGGSWAAERIYPGLNTNNVFGSYEFSDFPMTPEVSDSQSGSHIPGEGVHRYLCAATKHFGIQQFTRPRSKVEQARLLDSGLWKLSVSTTYGRTTLTAKKLVVATGLTSNPSMPTFEGQKDFNGLLIHSKDLRAHAKQLAKARKVVVIGGNKSAWDACYSVASSGGIAHMIVRPSGNGPSWAWPRALRFCGWTTSLSKLSLTRFWTLFDPWPFQRSRAVKMLLHRSFFGRWLKRSFWAFLGNMAISLNRYTEHPETKKLLPWSSTYWMGNSLSTLNYPSDWFELVRQGKIVVHSADVIALSANSAELSDGFIDDLDAIVCCTGWTAGPTLTFEPTGVRDQIGCPSSNMEPDAKLESHARQWILHKCPDLKDSASLAPELEEKSVAVGARPFRLYRFMIPPSPTFLNSKNLAFIGMDFSLHTVILAQAQALWITAFFNDKLPQHVLEPNHVWQNTILMTEYERIRRPGSGSRFPDLVFDSLPYVDLLLEDLGLKVKRKKSWIDEWFGAYGVKDYRGLVAEWQGCQRDEAKEEGSNH